MYQQTYISLYILYVTAFRFLCSKKKKKKVSSASFEAQPGPFCEVSHVASHLKKKIQTLGFKFMELECFKRSYS